MIKVLGLALYGPMAASTRYRLGQYISGLAKYQIDLQVRYLLGDEYLRRRFTGQSIPWTNLIKTGSNRLSDLCSRRSFDVIMLHCELFPLMPGWMECSLLPRPYIYDFDDAFYLKYRSGRLGIMRPLLGKKFDTVMESAAAITAGNNVLAEYARKINPNTHLLPTVVDTEHYVPTTCSPSSVFTVGWIGSPSTAPYLNEIVGPLSRIGKEGSVRLIVIGGKAPSIPNVVVEEIDWFEHTEVALINTFDVGVMPLPDDAWAKGKCAFKLIQYMACAVPVLASRVGANVDVVTTDCGFLATDEQEWVDALRFLRDQPDSRQQMGEVGRARVQQHYSLQVTGPRLAELIQAVTETR